MIENLKICLISFDNWNYDNQIVAALKKRNVAATHINIGTYKHKNLYERLKNLFSKVLFNKNLKSKNRQEDILKKLNKLEIQDRILVLNPDLIDIEYHLKIKKRTRSYSTYLYDSIARSRNPIEHLLKDNLFDTIFSFDENDCKEFGFIKINNYIYFDKQLPISETKYNLVTVASFDKRFPVFNKIAHALVEEGIKIKFIFVSRNIVYKKFKYNLKIFLNPLLGKKTQKSLIFKSKKMNNQKLLNQYESGAVILDIVQGEQSGLSFRVFEAMGMQKKLITDNFAIKNYNFYDSNNILVIDKNNPIIPKAFLESGYKSIPEGIYEQYTLDSWVNKIFDIT